MSFLHPWLATAVDVLSLAISILAIWEWRRARRAHGWARFAFDNYCLLISRFDQSSASEIRESLKSGATPPPWPPSVPDAGSDRPTSAA